MVHRTVIGSLERLVAHLIETHNGAFPPWYAPVVLGILPVGGSPHEMAWAVEVHRRALAANLRAELLSAEAGSLGARIRSARLIPYLAVVGGKEVEAKCVSLRLRDGRQVGIVSTEEAVAGILARVRSRTHELWSDT
jgi:threonyl-tRNA synthetase